jgi:hypothetical protein
MENSGHGSGKDSVSSEKAKARGDGAPLHSSDSIAAWDAAANEMR